MTDERRRDRFFDKQWEEVLEYLKRKRQKRKQQKYAKGRELSVYMLLKEATLEKIRNEQAAAVEEMSRERPGMSSIRVA